MSQTQLEKEQAKVQQTSLSLPCEARRGFLYTDGASEGNPGPAGIGVVLTDSEGNLLEELSEPIGCATNNEAEYRALIRGLELACQHGITHLNWYSDSELVVKQWQGYYRVKQPHLEQLIREVRQRVRALTEFHAHHLPREQNRRADKLARRGARLNHTP